LKIFILDLTDFISRKIRKRIDIGITQIYNNYFSYKQLYNIDNLALKNKTEEFISTEYKNKYESFLQQTFYNLQHHDPRDL
jgi:hypothetical protein